MFKKRKLKVSAQSAKIAQTGITIGQQVQAVYLQLAAMLDGVPDSPHTLNFETMMWDKLQTPKASDAPKEQ